MGHIEQYARRTGSGFFGIFLQPFQEKTVLLFSELRTMYRGFGDLSVILISVKDNS